MKEAAEIYDALHNLILPPKLPQGYHDYGALVWRAFELGKEFGALYGYQPSGTSWEPYDDTIEIVAHNG